MECITIRINSSIAEQVVWWLLHQIGGETIQGSYTAMLRLETGSYTAVVRLNPGGKTVVRLHKAVNIQ